MVARCQFVLAAAGERHKAVIGSHALREPGNNICHATRYLLIPTHPPDWRHSVDPARSATCAHSLITRRRAVGEPIHPVANPYQWFPTRAARPATCIDSHALHGGLDRTTPARRVHPLDGPHQLLKPELALCERETLSGGQNQLPRRCPGFSHNGILPDTSVRCTAS